MEIKKQLSIFLENRSGNLAKFASILEKHSIDIQAISITDAVDHAVIRIVVNDPSKCSHVLGDQGIVVIESDVVQVNVTHKPGELKRIAEVLSKEDINIDYIYGSQCNEIEKASLYLRVSDPKKALEMLKKDIS